MKVKSPRVSIIVPIYNVEQYLKECVDSILKQTVSDIEVILVDDGSPDKCGEIIDEYAKQDKRVIAVHQKNSGYSAAINKGIDKARGEFIGIIESDDWIEPDMYEKLLTRVSDDVDIVKGGFFKYNSFAKDPDTYFVNPKDVDLRLAPKEAFDISEWPQILAMHASIWSSIYRAELVKKHRMPESAGASYQDLPFMIETMLAAHKIAVVADGLVHWRNEPNQSHSTSAKGEKLFKMADNTLLAKKLVCRDKRFDSLKEGFFTQAIWTNSGFFYNISDDLKPEYYNRMREIFDGAEIKGTFLRPEDKSMLKAIQHDKGWKALKRAYILGGIRRKLLK